MEKTQHTPGPWTVVNPPRSRFFGVHGGLRTVASGIANRDDAFLIAAAPDLLDAAKELVAHSFVDGAYERNTTPRMDTLRAAIAKAEEAQL